MKSSFDALSGIGWSCWQQGCKEDATTYRTFCSFINIKYFLLFSDKMCLFQTLWKSKVILTKQDWNERQLKLLMKILNKFSESLCPVSSNEKISNNKHDSKNWKLICVLRFSLFFRFSFEKSIFFYVLSLLRKDDHV